MTSLFAKRDFSADRRRHDARSGAALPDGSFPIESEHDIQNALRLIGHSKHSRATVVAHIKSRARALGVPDPFQKAFRRVRVIKDYTTEPRDGIGRWVAETALGALGTGVLTRALSGPSVTAGGRERGFSEQLGRTAGAAGALSQAPRIARYVGDVLVKRGHGRLAAYAGGALAAGQAFGAAREVGGYVGRKVDEGLHHVFKGSVEQTMHEYKHGKLRSGSKHGPKVTSRAQAIAIALHQAGLSNR